MSKLEGSKIRANGKYLENAEKPSRNFLQREQSRGNKKSIKKLDQNGKILEDLPSIIEACKIFYADLYSEEPVDRALLEDFLSDLPKLTDENKLNCEGHITYEECEASFTQMDSHKTPGSDGLPKEFYSKFFYLFGTSFVKMVNLCYDFDSLSDSQRACLITLLCKNLEKEIYLSFWRPISLLNCDYKIVAKVLANRLKRVIGSIVHFDQACSIVGRSISNNCHLIRNIIDYVEERNLPCALVNLDQMKAFDRVSHEFLFSTLEAFGFGPSYIKWVKLLYTNINSAVLVNGYISDTFQVSRGVPQGCPLSPLLYVLCIESFAVKIRSDPHIQGIVFPGSTHETRISLYADDNTGIVVTMTSIRKFLLVSELYGLASGSRLNLFKCTLTLLGAALLWDLPPDNFGITLVPFSKILGLRFGNCDIYNENWNPVLKKVEATISSFSQRRLSLRGKAVVLNTCVLSKLLYVGRILKLPDYFLHFINKYMFQVIWNKKTEWINRDTLYLNTTQGGIGLVNIAFKLKAFAIMHIIEFLYGPQWPWCKLARFWLALDLRNFKDGLYSNSQPHSLWKPPFYKYCVKSFKDFASAHPAIDLHVMTSKKIYDILLQDHTTIPLVVQKYPTIDFGPIFKQLDDKILSPEVRNTLFKIIHKVLPVNIRLHRFHISPTVLCPLCKSAAETYFHLFNTCTVTAPLWTIIEDIFFNLCNHRLKPEINLVLYGIIPNYIPSKFKSLAYLLTGMLKHCIWVKRCEVVFQRKTFFSEDIKLFFLAFLKRRVLCDNVRFTKTKFEKTWCANNVICCKSGNTVDFLL